MNSYLKNIFMVIVLIVLTLQAQTQETITRKEQKAQEREQSFNEINTMLEGLNFNFMASKANPQGGKQVDLTTHTAYFKVIGDSLDVYLPFFGRAYNVPYGGSGGIECNGKYTDFESIINEKRNTNTLKFKCKGEGQTYEFSLAVTHSGSATLNVISSQRAGISYYGKIEKLNLKEQK